jgi:ribosomal 30S subunit maturation factor RimM
MGAARDQDAAAPGRTSEQVPPGAFRVGRLGRTYGLEGAQRLHAAGPREADAVLASTRVWVEGHGELTVRLAKPHAGALLVAFGGVRSPERAQRLVNADVYLLPADVPPDLRDRAVDRLAGAAVHVDGAHAGEVLEVHAGPQLLLLVRVAAGERWLPADAPYVRLGDGRVDVTDPPPGLLDDEA